MLCAWRRVGLAQNQDLLEVTIHPTTLDEKRAVWK